MPTATETYFTVPLEDLRTATVLGFDLYIRHIDRQPVLYRSRELEFTALNRERLVEGGITELLVPVGQRERFEAYKGAAGTPDGPAPPARTRESDDERGIERLVLDRGLPLGERCERLLAVTRTLIGDVLTDLGEPGLERRVGRVAEACARLLLDDPAAYPSLVENFQLDFQTYNHSTHTAIYTLELARASGIDDVRDLARISRAALLHDVGKGEIPADILHKDGPLDDLEWAEVMTHPDRGVEMLKRHGWSDETSLAACGLHHERWDGSGYPRGLAGGAIPLAARMVAITDTFDALTSDYPYRPALSGFQALWKMRHEMKGQFDPVLLERFIDAMTRRAAGR